MTRSLSNPVPLTERDLSALICSLSIPSIPILLTERDLTALTCSLSDLSRAGELSQQLSQQLTSIKCTTLASSNAVFDQPHLTVVPSTKGWYGGRSWLFRLQQHSGPHSLALLSCGYATIQLVDLPILDTVSTWLHKISHPQFLVLQYLGISQKLSIKWFVIQSDDLFCFGFSA